MAPQPDFSKRRVRVPAGSSRVGRPSTAEQEHLVVTGGQHFMPAFKPNTGLLEFANMDEIIRRHGWNTYKDMRHDAQVKAALSFKKTLVAGRAFDVTPASDDPKDKEVAEFVQFALKRARFNQIVKEAASAFEFGFSAAELVWKLGAYQGQPAVLLDRMKFRDPKTMTVMTDMHGNVTGFRQYGDRGELIDLPPRKMFHYAYNAEFGSPYGMSDLRSVYKNWWSKKFIIQFWNVFLERMGAPIMAVKYPQGAPEELKSTLKKILQGLSSKTEMLIPQGVEVELIEAQRAGQAGYRDALEYHDREISRGILVPALLGMSSDQQRGSDSQSRLHLRTLFKVTGMISDEIRDAAHEQIVKRLVDFNFDVTEYPEITWGDYGEFEMNEIIDAIRLMHSAGVLDMNQEDVNYARSVIGLPLRAEDEADEVVRPPAPPPPASANKPPPPAQQGNERGAGRQGVEDDANAGSS